MFTAIAFGLFLFNGLLYVSSSDSDTSGDNTSYAVETSEDEDYKKVMGLDVNMTTIKTVEMLREPLRTSKRPGTTDKDAGVPLYRPNATERERINKQYEAWLSATTPPPTVVVVEKPEPKGPFYEFIKNICNVTISRFSGRKIINYLTVLAKSLRGVGSGFIMKRWVRKFRKRIRFFTDYRGRFIRPIIQMFCNYTTERRQCKDMFFNTINPIFSVADDNRFDNYIYDLKRFGASRLRNIEKRTRYVFNRIIHTKLVDQKERVLDNIKLKFDLLLIEYHELRKKGIVEF